MEFQFPTVNSALLSLTILYFKGIKFSDHPILREVVVSKQLFGEHFQGFPTKSPKWFYSSEVSLDPQVTPQLVKSLQSLKKSEIGPESVKKLKLNFYSADNSISHNLDEAGRIHLDDWPVQRFGSQLKSLECLHVDYCLDEYDVMFDCMPALKTKNGLDFTLPLLQGLQSCANLKYLKFNFTRNFENMGFDNAPWLYRSFYAGKMRVRY